jgi:nucleoside-diphosphate-sugar epimerase
MATHVLVTGSTGFIGRCLTNELVQRGFKVRCAVRNLGANTPHNVKSVVVGDIGPATCWKEAVEGVATVLHLAGKAHTVSDNETNRYTFSQVNVGGTKSLANAAAAAGCSRFIFVSSIGVNGQSSGKSPFTERDTPRPENAYALSKLESEKYLREAAAQHGMEWCIVRPPLVYGPKAPGNFARLMRYVARGWPLPLGLATARRSFIALDNLVSVLLRLIDGPAAKNKTFVVSDGHDISTSDFVRGMAEAMGKRALLLPVPPTVIKAIAGVVGQQREAASLFEPLEIDSSQLRDRLRWTPVVTFQEGMKRAVQACDQ